jgi:PST family polysaccharide transporter
MTLIKTSLINGVAVAIKMLTLLGLNKILAVYVGPAGYATLGNFQNVMQAITIFAGGAINTGVIKYTAEYNSNEDEQRLIWRTAGTAALLASMIFSIVIYSFSSEMAHFFLKDEVFGVVFILFSLMLIFFTLNTLLLAILNGKKYFYHYVAANIVGSLLSLIVTSILTFQFGLKGALTALVIYPSFSFFATLYICYKTKWFKLSYLFGKADNDVLVKLSKYALLALTSAACVPASQILVRNHLGESLGWEVAGQWEAMWRISGAYLMFVTTTLSLYYLPRLSELKRADEIKKEILLAYKIILPLASLFGVCIFLFRDSIVGILFTPEFLPMRDLFAMQMFGDTLKIGSWILSYLMLGQSLIKMFLITEVIFSFSFYFLTYLFTTTFGAQAPVFAHALNYGIYWLVMVILIKKFLRKIRP